MSPRPSPLSLTADRRAREGARGVDVRGPISQAQTDRTIGRGRGARPALAERPPGAGLTRRERRVQAILVKELENLSQGIGLSYVEKQKLVKTLDVAFIDAELAKMDVQDARIRAGFKWVGVPVALLAVGAAVYYLTTGQPLDSVFPILYPLLFGVTFVQTLRANRRRRWIYEALRELSDAEDMDIQLPDSVALADLLIDRIVATEEEAARSPLHRIRA